MSSFLEWLQDWQESWSRKRQQTVPREGSMWQYRRTFSVAKSFQIRPHCNSCLVQCSGFDPPSSHWWWFGSLIWTWWLLFHRVQTHWQRPFWTCHSWSCQPRKQDSRLSHFSYNMFDYASFIMYVKQVPQVQYGWEYSTHVDSFYHRHDIITWNNQEKHTQS